MPSALKQFGATLAYYKVGILWGAAVGAGAAYYVISQGGIDVVLQSGKSLLDSMMSRSAPTELATYKIYGTFILICATLGGVIDWLIDKLHLRKRR